MRSCFAALVALAIVTECLSADRSRHRGPVRSVPVAADIKRDVDFDCPEEFGYYPHPTDCTLYYVCVFGGALLESCTGGLMYSHELQTCDWPRNVGCDGASSITHGGEELERISEREPPPRPPPRRTPPPPPPRAQPKPIITSRGQPNFSRNEYQKQQQLYAEVDDLPPVEEIETDRQQRVYRGQPSTIGQVQKDRDGYSGQVNSGRNLNPNIIQASIPQNSGKIGSFSFGSQVDDRRTATVTPAPQNYNEDEWLTDSNVDRLLDVDNKINDVTKQPMLIRRKRDVEHTEVKKNETMKNTTSDGISERSSDDFLEYYELNANKDADDDNEEVMDDAERGKRQIAFYNKNGFRAPSKSNWSVLKPIKFVDIPQNGYRSTTNGQNNRYQQNYNNANNNNYYDSNRRPHSIDSNSYSNANPFLAYQSDSYQAQRPFKPSIPDYNSQKQSHNPLNIATQIITKSPPISTLNNNQNQFSSFHGGFYNNAPQIYSNNQFTSQGTSVTRPNSQISFKDSSLLPSSVVTGKPVPMPTSPRNSQYNQQKENNDYEEESNSEEDESSEEDDDETFSHSYPKPPHEFTHPQNKYANIENPFASPNFDFDEYLTKLSNGQYTTHNPKNSQNAAIKSTQRPFVSSTPSQQSFKSSTLNYKGMSTPRPFSVIPSGSESTLRPVGHYQQTANNQNEHQIQRFQPSQQIHSQQQQLSSNVNNYNQQYLIQNNYPQQSVSASLDSVRPKLKPPNFNDDRQLPISYSFARPIDITTKPNNNQKFNVEAQPLYSTSEPYLFLTATGQPIILSSPKANYIVQNEKLVSQRPLQDGKQYFASSVRPQSTYSSPRPSTSKPLTTLANEQLSALQHFWKSTTESILHPSVTLKPTTSPDYERLKNLFAQAVKTSMQTPVNNPSFEKFTTTTTTNAPKVRRPIPKPSPEMNDYYYDDDEYYEPPVKSQYMPSTEVKPQRPVMAQNDKEYDDSYETSEEQIVNIRTNKKPTKFTFKPEAVTKNYNDVAIVTKSSLKNHQAGKIRVPVLLDFVTPTPTVLIRPQLGNFEIVHGSMRNHTAHLKSPIHGNGPNTIRPPKYLNQTTLRPYTVRHRLAKPTTALGLDPTTQKVENVTRGRHHNIVAQMLSTPRDSHNQETRVTKSKYDGRTNSLEPTESVSPISYSPSPRPKMLYNGSQSYQPDQYDPFYAIYDEDGELYKDTDYVQQYNVASVRPAVQQTYRGTPPPARRPVEYSPRPVSNDDYDDELIQGQINIRNQNQYQSPVRQSTRGEGNELGYEHIPSSVKTTIYETSPLSTIPTTTSTSTTTQRPTTAHFTEAMTPSRYTPRSSTDENPIPYSETSSNRNTSEGSFSSSPSTQSPVINFSSLAKPFEKTDNLHSLDETVSTTEKLPPRRSHVTNNNNDKSVEVVRSEPNKTNKKYVSLTTGFSIRRNSNNTNNPYTLTVLTRPFDEFGIYNASDVVAPRDNPDRYFYKSNDESTETPVAIEIDNNQYDKSSENPMRRKDSRFEINDDYDIPVNIRPSIRGRTKHFKAKSTPSTTPTTKYYIKSVIKRPAPFSKDANDQHEDSNDSVVENVHTLIDVGLQNARANIEPSSTTNRIVDITPKIKHDRSQYKWKQYNRHESLEQDSTTSRTSTTQFTTSTTTTTERHSQYFKSRDNVHSKPSYYSYRIEDDIEVPDSTTEVFGSTVKTVIKAFFNNIVSTPLPEPKDFSTYKPTTITPKTVHIGFHKKPIKYVNDKPLRQNVQHLHIITEPSLSRHATPSAEPEVDNTYTQANGIVPSKDLSSTSTMAPMNTIPSYVYTEPETTPISKTTTTTTTIRNIPDYDVDSYDGKFSSFVTSAPKVELTPPPVVESSRKFQNYIKVEPTSDTKSYTQTTTTSQTERYRPSEEIVSEIASTTSTTKSTTTTTVKIDPTTKAMTKSVSFPTRASRINPAIKLAATNPGSGRRSYQSSSKCSSDNSLQANPKCNEIKYQRPTSTRGRGSAHYSTQSGSDSPQPVPNRGTPPTRSRPTLKPSTAIVSKNYVDVDIYTNPPSRPAPVYPQPTPDKTAAKCRKDVCLLPDCYCGGKDIPGDLPVNEVPQIVLITFDDAVNDLNNMYYEELFQRGRVNPNGCPITATFYVSHEWTDYSQVQNLYVDGHEFASHTISHSFGEQFSQKKWNREVGGQREILAAYGGVKLEDVRGMRAPFLSIGGNKMFKMLYDSNFTYDSSMPVYENKPPSWPYTLDYKLFHDCMIPPCPTKSYPGVWEVPMVMWQDLNGGRCSMGDACANPPESDGVYKMLLKNFDRHYTTNRAPFGLFYHAAWFTQPHHKEGFIKFLDFINQMQDVWIVTNWQALQWVRDPTPISRLNNFQPFQCNYQDRPKKCNNPKVCNLWHKSGVRYMRTCQPCPEIYPWTGKSGIRSSRIDNDNGE